MVQETLGVTGTKEVTSELGTGGLARLKALQLSARMRIKRPRRWAMLNDSMLNDRNVVDILTDVSITPDGYCQP